MHTTKSNITLFLILYLIVAVPFTYQAPKTQPRSVINENDRELETLVDKGRLLAEEWECFDFALTPAEPD